ncbi:MAG: hypothetical protein OEM44_07980 [Nitrosopumilus sp.]|nr:hypothetical protein [Nitrosopumilus sp.]
MVRIPIKHNSPPEVLQCTVCLLPMQYQSMKNGKFVWQCFKCGKQYLISKHGDEDLEESRSPPR